MKSNGKCKLQSCSQYRIKQLEHVGAPDQKNVGLFMTVILPKLGAFGCENTGKLEKSNATNIGLLQWHS